MNEPRTPEDRSPSPATPSLHVLDNLFEGCQLLDSELRYRYLNHQAASHARYPREQLIGRRMAEVYPDIDRTEMYALLLRCLRAQEPGRMENRFRYPDGIERVFDLRMEPVPEGIFVLSVDVTERQEALDQVRRSEAMLARAEQVAGIGNWLWDVERDRVTWSQGLFRILQMNPAEGAPPFAAQEALYHPEDWPNLRRAVERAAGEGRYFVLPVRMLRADGVYRSCVARGYPEAAPDGVVRQVFGTLQDVTELLALQQQAQKKQRLEAIGSLAGGVAHDFNNILMAQMGFCDLAAEEVPPDGLIRESFTQIRACAERAATLTRQLLAFSRKQAMQPVPLDLNSVVRGVESLLRRLIGEDVNLEVFLAEDVGSVLADPSQIEQIVMNLAVNSRDAMPEGGRLTIETGNIHLDEAYAAEHEGATPGPHVMLAISDTGVGMSPETRERLFEPFFTTKAAERGTGMGLAMVYGIVKQSGGNIWVYSEPGAGSTFKVYLPRVDTEPVPAAPARSGPISGGRETVLVVEDDTAVANLLGRMLGKLGYEVHRADDGEAALARVLGDGLRPQLLITDVVMPGMGGRELAQRLQERLPSLQVLFMSGYTENAIVHQGVLDPGLAFLQKPFNFEDLAAGVRGLLDRNG